MTRRGATLATVLIGSLATSVLTGEMPASQSARQGPNLCGKLLDLDNHLQIGGPVAKGENFEMGKLACPASDLASFKRTLDEYVFGEATAEYSPSDEEKRAFESLRAALCSGGTPPSEPAPSFLVFAGQTLLDQVNQCLSASYANRPGMSCGYSETRATDSMQVTVQWNSVVDSKQSLLRRGPFVAKFVKVSAWNGDITEGGDVLKSGERVPESPTVLSVKRRTTNIPIAVSVVAQGSECHFYTPVAPQYLVKGELWAEESRREAITQQFSHVGRSNDCDASSIEEREFCLPEDAIVEKWEDPALESVNTRCGSSVRAPKGHPTRKNCIIGAGIVKGCGYRVYPFDVKECLGRGWFGYTVTVHGFRILQNRSQTKTFDLVSLGSDPLEVVYPKSSLPPEFGSGQWRFNAEVLVLRGTERRVEHLSTASPTLAQDEVRALLSKEGALRFVLNFSPTFSH